MYLIELWFLLKLFPNWPFLHFSPYIIHQMKEMDISVYLIMMLAKIGLAYLINKIKFSKARF